MTTDAFDAVLPRHACNAWCADGHTHAEILFLPPAMACAEAVRIGNALLDQEAIPWQIVQARPAHESPARMRPGALVRGTLLSRPWIATGTEAPYLVLFCHVPRSRG